MKINSNDLLDLIEDLGLNERQQIGTLLNEVEALDEEDSGEDEEDEVE
jgi:hypothetical protein